MANTLYDLLATIITKTNQSVKTVSQTLTDIQKTQARANIDALGKDYTPPIPSAEQVGADSAGTAIDVVSEHNVDPEAHSDIRVTLGDFMDRVNAILNSDNETLDQWTELVAYIDSNKDLIDSITTSKVNVADIVDNLETAVSNKPLSANMGVEIKKLIDNLAQEVEDKSDLTEAEIQTLINSIQ